MIYPIVLFCYNRPSHLKRTVAALLRNDLARESELYIYSDGQKSEKDLDSVKAVRDYIERIEGFKGVHIKKHLINIGLASSVKNGVSEVLSKHKACIVMEDDMEAAPYFLRFMNLALEQYERDSRIFSISGYCPPINVPSSFPYDAFLFPRINSWGWATWRDRWTMVDWEVRDFNEFIRNRDKRRSLEEQGKDLPVMLLKQQKGLISSWAVRFNYACFKAGMLNVYPKYSLIRNIGADGSGSHLRLTSKYEVALYSEELLPFPAESDNAINVKFKNFFKPSIYRRVINKFKIASYIWSIS